MSQRSRLSMYALWAIGCSIPALAFSPQEAYRVEASDGAVGDSFGFDLDVSGPLAIAGAHHHDAGFSQGAAYVLDWATGTEVHKLLPSVPFPSMGFGWSVAIGDTMALVGAPFDRGASASTGSAFVFELSTGLEAARIEASTPSPQARFGHAVDIDGDLALIGAPGDNDRMGAGYLFDLKAGTQLAKWVPSDAMSGGFDGYGSRVAIDGDYAILARVGSVAVYDVASGTELYTLARPGTFGLSLDVSDGLLVVGAITDADVAASAGAAYVFDLASGAEVAKLLAYDGAPFDRMGVSVAVSGSRIVTGALNSNASGTLSGAAYVYDRESFQQIARVVPSDGQAFDRFGRAVAGDGTSFLVGAVGSGSSRGAAYRFDAADLLPGSPSCFGRICPCGTGDPSAGCPNGTGAGARLQGLGSASMAQNDLSLETSSLPPNQLGLYVMGSMHAPASSAGNGLLCMAGSLFRFPVQSTGIGSADLELGMHAAPGNITAGSSWTFQFSYRDGGSFCPASFNSSNAWTVLFTP